MRVRGQHDAPAARAQRRYPSRNRIARIPGSVTPPSIVLTLEHHLSVLIATLSHPDMQKIRKLDFTFKIGYIGGLNFGCYYLQSVPASKTFRQHMICSSSSHNAVLYLVR